MITSSFRDQCEGTYVLRLLGTFTSQIIARLVVVILSAMLSQPAFGQNVAQSGATDKLDNYLKAEMAKQHIPALSVAIIRDGQVIKIKGYGMANLELGAPVTQETVYQIASATKPLTGTALMMLVEDGKIALDDKVTKYLLDLPPVLSTITVRQLASHTSGIKDVSAMTDTPETREQVIKTISPLPVDFAPGEKEAYNLTGYGLLLMIMEKVTGKSFPEFMNERLFKPLGMNSTRFSNSGNRSWARISDVIENRASVYIWEGEQQHIYDYFYPTWTYSAGGLFSTASDLAKWAAALDTGKLLKKTSLEQMWTPAKLNDGKSAGFALGWVADEVNGHKVVGHSGGPALADILRFGDEKLTVIVLTNQRTLSPYLAGEVANFYLSPQKPAE
jgi:CubicO group peptidase (beta-lactamase class C family)